MTAISQINAGGRLAASLLRAVAPLSAYKGADQSVTSSTTLVNDNALYVSVDADATYLFVCILDYEGGTWGSSDLKLHWSLPSGVTMRWMRLGTDNTGSPPGTSTDGAMSAETATVVYGTNGAGTLRGVLMIGTLAVGSTAGDMQLQWAQNTSNATATIVHAQSVLGAWQIA